MTTAANQITVTTRTLTRGTDPKSGQRYATITSILSNGIQHVGKLFENGETQTATFQGEPPKSKGPLRVAVHRSLSDQEKDQLHKQLQFNQSTATCPNAKLTLTFNTTVSQDYALSKLKLFYKRIQEITFGHTWHKAVTRKTAPGRRNVIAAPAYFAMENVDSNLHWHGALFLTRSHYKRLKLKVVKLQNGSLEIHSEKLAKVWKSLQPSGTMHLNVISPDHLSRETYYVIKYINTVHDLESKFVIAPSFDRT